MPKLGCLDVHAGEEEAVSSIVAAITCGRVESSDSSWCNWLGTRVKIMLLRSKRLGSHQRDQLLA
jgi:hypothetical protein